MLDNLYYPYIYMGSNAVEEKKKENNNIKEDKVNDWKGFGIGCLTNFAITILIGLIGSNFIYLTSLSNNSKNILFPSDNYFKSDALTGGSGIEIGPLGSSLQKLGIPPSTGWPYSMKEGKNIDFTKQGFSNWVALSVADTYIPLRKMMKTFLNFFNNDDKNIFSHDLVQIVFSLLMFGLMTICFPFMLIALILFPFLINCVRGWSDGGPLFFLVVFFCLGGWLAAGISLLLPLQFMFTFLLLPLFIDAKSVGEIGYRNLDIFRILFGGLCIATAFDKLTPPNQIGFFIYTVVSFLLLFVRKFI